MHFLSCLVLVLVGRVLGSLTWNSNDGHETSKQRAPSLGVLSGLPDFLLREVVTMMFGSRMSSLARNQDVVLFFRQMFRLPALLAYLTEYDGFGKMSLGPELVDLFCTAKTARNRLYLALNPRIRYPLKSTIAIDYINNTIMKFKDVYSRDEFAHGMAHHFCNYGEYGLLSYFIDVAANDVVRALYMPFYISEEWIFELPGKSMDSTLKLYHQSTESNRACMLVGIFLAPIDEAGLADARSLLMRIREARFVEKALEDMISAARKDWNFEYLSRNKELARNNEILLKHFETLVDNDVELLFLVNYVRLLYSIRLGCRLKGTNDASSESVEEAFVINSMLIADMETLELLSELSTREEYVAGLVDAVVYARNRELFARILPLMHELGHRWSCNIISHSDITYVVNFSQYMELLDLLLSEDSPLGRDCRLMAMRIYKAEEGTYYGYDWGNLFEGASARLLMYAEMQDYENFRAAVQTHRENGDFEILEDAIRIIITYVESPISFVGAILETGYRKKYRDPLCKSKFLRSLLIKSHDGSIFDQLSQYKITPQSQGSISPNFYSELLKDRDLADSFRGKLGSRLRSVLCVDLLSLPSMCSNRIVELLEILRVPVLVNKEAFYLGVEHEHDELNSKLDYLEDTRTLAEVDIGAQEPGFLAYLSLLYLRYYTVENGKRMLILNNPFEVPALGLLKRWYQLDRQGFIAHVDWQAVMIIFGAVLRVDHPLYRIIEDATFPATLEYVIRQHFRNRMVTLEFHSALGKADFENVLLPMIRNVANEVGCKLKFRVVGLTALQQCRAVVRGVVRFFEQIV